MLRLSLGTRDPEWVELGHGVAVFCRPMSSLLMNAARRSALIRELGEDADNDAVAFALARAVAREAVLDWRGVGDMDGNALEVSADGLDALLDLPEFYDAFLVRYLSRGVALESEKNAYAPSPSGTSAGAPNTAKGARAGGKAALTRSTRQKRPKAQRSGI